MYAWGDVRGRHVYARLRWVFVRERGDLYARQVLFSCAAMTGLRARTLTLFSHFHSIGRFVRARLKSTRVIEGRPY